MIMGKDIVWTDKEEKAFATSSHNVIDNSSFLVFSMVISNLWAILWLICFGSNQVMDRSQMTNYILQFEKLTQKLCQNLFHLKKEHKCF